MDISSNRRQPDMAETSPMSHVDEQSDHEDDARDGASSDESVNVNRMPNMPPGMEFGRSPDHMPNMNFQYQQNPLNLLTAISLGQNLQGFNTPEAFERLRLQMRDMQKMNLLPNVDAESLARLHQFGGEIANYAAMNGAAMNGAAQMGANNSNQFHEPSTSQGTKDANPASNQSASSNDSHSSNAQQGNWNVEEQFKQVRQLYEINDDPKRKPFLDDLFSFMQRKGTPINRLPIMAKSVLDLFELYNLVVARGGLVDVINKKLWQEIIKGLHLPSSITSAAFTLRTQYMKYLYPYESEKLNLSNREDLQTAIDGNKREGRRQSFNNYETQMQNPLQMVQHLRRSPNLNMPQPLPLVAHPNNQQHMHQQQYVPDVHSMLAFYSEMANKDLRNLSPEEKVKYSELQRLTLMSLYNNNQPPMMNPAVNHIQPQNLALNLSEALPQHPHVAIKRERDADHEQDLSFPVERKRLAVASTSRMSHHASPQNYSSERSTPSVHENGINDYAAAAKVNGGSSTSSEQSTPSPILNGMQFRIESQGESSSGKQQLSVKMEVNGVQYEGFLFASSNVTKVNTITSNGNRAESMDGRSSRSMIS